MKPVWEGRDYCIVSVWRESYKGHSKLTRWRGRAQLGFDRDGSEEKLRALGGVSILSMYGRGNEFKALGRLRVFRATAGV